MKARRVTLADGPANGEQILVFDRWAWVAKHGGELHVYNMDKPDDEQTLSLLGRGGWHEYREEPRDPTVYRWARRTP